MSRLGVFAVLTCLLGVGFVGLAPEANGHMKTVGDTARGGEAFVDEGDTIAIPAHAIFVDVEIVVVVTVVAMSGQTVVFEYEGLPYSGRALLSLGEKSLSESNLPQGWNRVGTLRGALAHGTFFVNVEGGPAYRTYSAFLCGQGSIDGPITLSIDGRTHSMHVCTLAPWTNTQVANVWHCESFSEPEQSDILVSLESEPCESPEHVAVTIVRDTDGDGAADHNEILDAANPGAASSMPSTDDDGDGTVNLDEALPVPITPTRSGCSGAQGIVVGSVCEGYIRPYLSSKDGCYPRGGCFLSTEEEAAELGAPYVDGDGQIWIWDATCLPGAGGDYTPCKDGNYEADDATYTGGFLTDGYGWRRVTGVNPSDAFPVTVPLVDVAYYNAANECDRDIFEAFTAGDQDGDGVVRFCVREKEIEVYEDGSFDDNTTQTHGPFGDPDDQDPDNPVDRGAILQEVDAVVSLLEDPDEDGVNTLSELQDGSHPSHAQSTPETDDDGDGVLNRQEIRAVVCTGAYGVVLDPSCNGYAWPDGCASGGVGNFVCIEGGDVWVWDAVCLSAATGDYGACKGIHSNYEASPGPGSDGSGIGYYDASGIPLDGYGWRRVAGTPLLLPATIEYQGICDDGVRDTDADGFFFVRVCNRNLTIEPDGSHSDEETGFEREAGDPDDSDPDNPVSVPALLALLQDPDEDSHATVAEVDDGSQPLYEASTPVTDDDGDGVLNRQEIRGAVCTGAYGIVWQPSCNGYTWPSGCPTGGAGNFVCIEENRVWLWDAYCRAGMLGSYDACRSQSNYGAAPGSGGDGTGPGTYDAAEYQFDGYGWRNLGSMGILESREFFYVGLCDEPTRDADGDGIPLFRVCSRVLTVHPDGSHADEETAPEGEFGDADDSDERVPVDRDGVLDQVDQWQRFVNGTVEDALIIVEEAQREAERLQRDVDDLHNETAQAVEAYQRLVGDVVNQTLDDVQQRAEQLIEDLDDLVALAKSLREEAEGTAEAAVEDAGLWLACTDEELGRYVAAVDSSSSNETAFRIQLTEGAARWQQRNLQCFDHVDFGALQPIMNQTFAQTRFLLNVVEGNLHSGNRLYNDTFAFAQERVDFILNGTGPIVEEEIEQVEEEMAQLINRIERDVDNIQNAAMREVLEAIREGDPTLFDSLEDPSDAERGEEENRTASFFDQVETNRGRIVVVVLLIMVGAAVVALLRRR